MVKIVKELYGYQGLTFTTFSIRNPELMFGNFLDFSIFGEVG